VVSVSALILKVIDLIAAKKLKDVYSPVPDLCYLKMLFLLYG